MCMGCNEVMGILSMEAACALGSDESILQA